MIFKILKIERKQTASGKDMARLNLQNPDGVIINDVTIWGDYPNFATLDVGHTTEGDVQEKQNGQYVNKTLYPARTNTLGAKRGGAGMAATMEKKEKSIGAAMDRKENSIEKMAVFRDSTLLTVAYINKLPMEDVSEAAIKEIWMKWRAWLESQLGEVPF